MAIAGRVAIVPKDAYDSTVAYQKLDLVRYNHNVYIAKKSSTGILPTDEEYWMLAIENVTQEQYEAIVNGTTAVGNALKANGVTLYKEFTEIDSTFTQDTAITDVVSKMAPDSKLCVTIYSSTSGIYPSGNGVLEIDKHSVNGNFTSVKFTDRNNGKLYTAVVQLDTFAGWTYSADGGNADTVDGKHASDFVQAMANLQHNSVGVNRTMQELLARRTVEFFTNWMVNENPCLYASGVIIPGADDVNSFILCSASMSNKKNFYIAYATKQDDGTYSISWDMGATTADLANYLPKSGGTLGNGDSYQPLGINGRADGTYLEFFGNGTRYGRLGYYSGAERFVLLDNQNQPYDILHTGNSAKVVVSETATTDTSALWVDNTNKKTKVYIDGAWTVIA